MNRDIEFLCCGRFNSNLSTAFSRGDLQSALLGTQCQYAPSREFDTVHVAIDLKVDFLERRVDAGCRTRLRAFRDDIRELHFNAASMRIQGVFLDGKKLAHIHKNSSLRIRLPRPLKAGEEIEVEVRYRISRPKEGLRFVPSHPAKSPARQVWTQGQPEDSRFWFPCHDAPHEKATSEIKATVPKGFTVVSNGRLIETIEDAKKGTVCFHWRMNRPHSLYLITFAAGRFGLVEEKWEDVPVQFFCEKGRESEAKRGLAKTVQAIEFFSKKLGVRYPYEKYAQVMVAEFPGGMENTSATTMSEACLIGSRAALDNDVDLLMAHELAHQWFGDLVTCRDWAHAWLNEGFATYFECLFTRQDKGQDEFDYELYRNQQDYFQEDRDRYRRPIATRNFQNPWVLFDRHLYQKASAVLHMLRSDLGDSDWWKAIAHYLNKHAYQSVETQDLLVAIEESTGRNLRPFFDQWIFRTAYPHFKARLNWRGKTRKLELHVFQMQRISEDSPAFKVPLGIRVEGKGWVKNFTKIVDGKDHRWEFQLPGEPVNVELDPHYVLLKKLDFQKPWSMWEYQLHRAPRAMSRVLAAQALSNWPTDAVVRSLREALRKEKFWGAAGEMAQALGMIRTPAAFEALKGFSRHSNPRVRRSVIQALGRFRHPGSAGIFLSRMKEDLSFHVQAEAARSLANLGDPKYWPHIKKKIGEESYWDIVRGGALGAIGSTKDPRWIGLLRKESSPDKSYPGRVYAIRALAEMAQASDRIVPWLCEYLEDTDSRVALTAASCLGRLEDERALPVLERVSKQSNNCRLKTAATEAMTRLAAGGSAVSSNRRGG